MVAVKDRDKLAFRVFQRVIDVAGLGVFMRGTGDVLYANGLGKLAELFAPTVVKNPDAQLVFRSVDAQRGINGVFHYAEVFVVSRNKNVHRRPLRHLFR